MPTYEYECRGCEYEFETFQSMKDDLLKKCPECGENELFRRIGIGAGIIFKGSGFYETDYRSDSYKKSAAKDKDGATGSKPARKSEKKSTKKKESADK